MSDQGGGINRLFTQALGLGLRAFGFWFLAVSRPSHRDAFGYWLAAQRDRAQPGEDGLDSTLCGSTIKIDFQGFFFEMSPFQ
jgi:hypothetical protein